VERSSVSNVYSRADTGWERTLWHRPSLLSVMLASETALLPLTVTEPPLVIEGRFDFFLGEVWVNERG